MNWIIRKTAKMDFHTNLKAILSPIKEEIKQLDWLITDLEYNNMYRVENLPVDYDHDYFLLPAEQFDRLVAADMQIIWAVILGIPETHATTVDPENLPYAEGNAEVWKNGYIQHPDAIIEIICFDSSYTILKFKDQSLSDKFKAHFDEAKELELISKH
jgi:hypothetical protein